MPSDRGDDLMIDYAILMAIARGKLAPRLSRSVECGETRALKIDYDHCASRSDSVSSRCVFDI